MNKNTLFADVVLPLPLNQLFTFSIPEELKDIVKKGKRVIVQFGARKIYTAIVYKIHQERPVNYETKDILSVLDNRPIINDHQFKLWFWISDYYMCALGEVYKAALPAGLKLESETRIIYNPDYIETDRLSKSEILVLDFLSKVNTATVQEITKALNRKNIFPITVSLLEKNAITIDEHLKEMYKQKTEPYIALHNSIKSEDELNIAIESLKRAPKQSNLLLAFVELSKVFNDEIITEVKKKTLLEHSKSTHQILKPLLEKKILSEYNIPISRLNLNNQKAIELKTLSDTQQAAYLSIQNQFLEKQVVLLHGVTSSGKTEVYIHLILEQLNKGKQVLYLLPEIALTAQIINRLRAVFGNKVGIYHSKFSDAERVEVYQNILNTKNENSYQLVLGVRSALFLPFSNLGLIIVDEEHEPSYKQYDPAPRYNARDSAIILAQEQNANVLLGSATPSIETYFNAKSGKFGFVELINRYLDIELPSTKLVDILRAKKRKEMKSHFSDQLINSITEALEQNEKVILFQNRRGFSPYLECETCGWIPYCPNCDVSLTYHQFSNELACHYCGFSVHTFKACKKCGNTALSTRGFGTEKIEEDIKIYFPNAKVVRMDLDTTRSKHSYQRIISDFEDGNIDILIGTQMVSKGLDFDHVRLVGILNADNMLNYPDFRSHERSYQLMAQVSGRAGRKNKQGKVIIQTNNPTHPILQFVIKNNYDGFYKSQLQERMEFSYPPFCRLINLGIKHKNPETANNAAQYLADNLKRIFGKRILGPQSPVIGRMHNLYIKNILIKVERQSSFNKAKVLLKAEIEKLNTHDNFKMVQITIDIDPI
ncbi:MAG: primosomal protein N' [Bacteroidetes bacterium GWF2_33_16]|nr:MAG: primosomal protein N' [Bacteroidetes bacterium GWE2_32_14]OFY05134.1 MAG: primosomal protein N' [Bacteroidetes bacterium GWF2_33_16]